LPTDIGEAPAWNPEKDKTKPTGNKKRNFHKKSDQKYPSQKPITKE
jgi:hypothetical protein